MLFTSLPPPIHSTWQLLFPICRWQWVTKYFFNLFLHHIAKFVSTLFIYSLTTTATWCPCSCWWVLRVWNFVLSKLTSSPPNTQQPRHLHSITSRTGISSDRQRDTRHYFIPLTLQTVDSMTVQGFHKIYDLSRNAKSGQKKPESRMADKVKGKTQIHICCVGWSTIFMPSCAIVLRVRIQWPYRATWHESNLLLPSMFL